ncbi:aquaporin [Patellaria atrata CBS 101060]|uniref:Aquaporin n=1 Tax=Patellaria atrata CBS 101060 TaxID=1346257 RepID=A0A9P4SH54_9PEZI|nr:aquaporin [Patellaria atrata CBS 101060]
MNINQPLQAFSLPFAKTAAGSSGPTTQHLRFPFAHHLPDEVRTHLIAMSGEYVGTVLFLYFALSGTQVANTIRSSAGLTVEEIGANPQQLQYIALSFGFSLAVNAWVFFRISGGLFNPAVTLGMCFIGALSWTRGTLLFITQILGGMTAAALVSCMFPGPLDVQTILGAGTSIVQGLFIEIFLTAQLVFTIFMLAAEKHKSTFIAPVGIGLSLFVAEMTGVYFTGGSLNPARSFGPAVVNNHFHGYHWIYWVGPILGALLAAGFYKFIKILEYETAYPDQDAVLTELKREKEILGCECGNRTHGTATGVMESEIGREGSRGTDGTVVEKEGPTSLGVGVGANGREAQGVVDGNRIQELQEALQDGNDRERRYRVGGTADEMV